MDMDLSKEAILLGVVQACIGFAARSRLKRSIQVIDSSQQGGSVFPPDEMEMGGSYIPDDFEQQKGAKVAIYSNEFVKNTYADRDAQNVMGICEDGLGRRIPDFRGEWTGMLQERPYFQKIEQCANRIIITKKHGDEESKLRYSVHEYEDSSNLPRLDFTAFFPPDMKDRKKIESYHCTQ